MKPLFDTEKRGRSMMTFDELIEPLFDTEKRGRSMMTFDELIERKMDEKFKNYELKFNSQLSWMEHHRKEIESALPNIKRELEEAVNSLLENSAFIQKMEEHFQTYIEQEIGAQIKNDGLHDLAKSLVIQKVMDDFKPIVSQVVDKVLNQMNRNLEKRYEVTRQMVYSIEKEIQHLTIRAAIGTDEEETIRQAISSVQKEQMLRIEGK